MLGLLMEIDSNEALVDNCIKEPFISNEQASSFNYSSKDLFLLFTVSYFSFCAVPIMLTFANAYPDSSFARIVNSIRNIRLSF